MRRVFVVTSYYLALLSPHDALHAAAVEWSRNLRCRVVVTEFVLVELANALSRAGTRQVFTGLLVILHADPLVKIVPLHRTLYQRGCELYTSRPDKDWSLTDCISFVVMKHEGINEALTADRHFEQAGFKALLKAEV